MATHWHELAALSLLALACASAPPPPPAQTAATPRPRAAPQEKDEAYREAEQQLIAAGYPPAEVARLAPSQADILRQRQQAMDYAVESERQTQEDERQERERRKARGEEMARAHAHAQHVLRYAAIVVAHARAPMLASVVICSTLDDIAAAQEAIAAERAGAKISGYVNKSTMHDAGIEIAEGRKLVAEYTASLRALKAKPIPCRTVKSRLGVCYPSFAACGAAGEVAKTAMYEFLWDDYPPKEGESQEIADAAKPLYEKTLAALDGEQPWEGPRPL